MASDRFLVLSNSALKVLSKNYSKVGIILDVNNEVVVETWMAKRCIDDYTSASLHGFAYFVLQPSFKRPFFVGKNSNLFYYLRFYFTKPRKSALLFRNDATRFHYKLQRRKFVTFSRTWGIKSTASYIEYQVWRFICGDRFMKNVAVTFSVTI